MSILSRNEILKAIAAGEIEVAPFNEEAVGCASIDLTLSNEFRYYKPGLAVVPVKEDTDYRLITEKVTLAEGDAYLLLPGQSCLAITVEQIKLAPTLCGLLEGRTRFARLGLFVHITAGFMQPGINNRQVLEIFNASNHPFKLYPGQRMCQFVFMKMTGKATYQGQFMKNKL